MIAEVVRFVSLSQEKGHDSLNEIVDFLKGWLINHINGTDKQYTEHLHQRGIN